MHRIAATPGGWNPDAEGVIILEQTPAPIVFLTAADTDIQTLAAAIQRLPPAFPALRCANLLQLQQQLSIDTYAETVLAGAKAIVLRLLGGRSYWSYGLEVVKEVAAETGATLLILPGDDRPDPTLVSHSTVEFSQCDRLWQYFREGGIDNYCSALCWISDLCLATDYNPPVPQAVPRAGLYEEKGVNRQQEEGHKSKVGILFYRAHYLSGNTAPVDALCQALRARNLSPIPVFVSSLRDRDVQEAVFTFLKETRLLLNTTSFSLLQIDTEDQPKLWQQLNIPVFQVILSGGTEPQWEESFQGLTPRDVAMNVALPEVDGRIVTRAISFKSVRVWNEALETDVIGYQPRRDRVDFVADLAVNWVKLQQTPKHERKIALILANYPNKDARLANGVGLDTPESCVGILKALRAEGYRVEDLPATGEELMARLTAGITNDLESRELRPIFQSLAAVDYQAWFQQLPEKVKGGMEERWGVFNTASEIAIAGIQLGNIFVGLQPSRGYDRDPSLNYHAPDLEPTPEYLAFYLWLRQVFQTDAMIHLGKHGNLEWLPGKSIALSSECYPEVALGAVPNFYPFIVNDPGEGSQAKRRSAAIILDHLTPPLTRAELYGGLQKLEALIDEYYEAQTLDPSRLKLISDRIVHLVREENLNRDFGLESVEAQTLAPFLTVADGYLCELKEAQIRDGLHIFGRCPQGRQLRDLIVAIARQPGAERLGLTRALAADLHLDFDPLTAGISAEGEVGDFPFPARLETNSAEPLPAKVGCPSNLQQRFNAKTNVRKLRNWGDIVEILEEIAAESVEALLNSTPSLLDNAPATQRELAWLERVLLPALRQTPQEITNLLRGLDGEYIPSGPSGAPTRGRPEVLPTGRNFYSVDIRAIPTETAWDTGRKAAEAVVERYAQDNGEYPQTLALSVWGTSTMRTGGDDVSQVLALLGVRPVWDGLSRRVVDFEILSLSALGRPRVDVTLRVSGFFRDSFPNLIKLLYDAIAAVSSLEEPPEGNPLAAKVREERAFWLQEGLANPQAEERALQRIFGSKPGAYGAGLQGLIAAQNWQTDADLARAYLNWSSYAYSSSGASGAIQSTAAPEAFARRLQQLQVVLHNQDNREHDLLDSDDYYQFQGGLTAAVRALTGKNPATYFGDNSLPAHPRVRLLKEEIARVYRSRVVNPKWIEGAMRHGYKGAFEMAATVDYLFAYDATARCVEDFMYEGTAEAYLFAPDVQKFIQQNNPWALRDMAERLLEASQRGLWSSAPAEMLERLRALVHEAEATIE